MYSFYIRPRRSLVRVIVPIYVGNQLGRESVSRHQNVRCQMWFYVEYFWCEIYISPGRHFLFIAWFWAIAFAQIFLKVSEQIAEGIKSLK